jgi:hypothetical protein
VRQVSKIELVMGAALFLCLTSPAFAQLGREPEPQLYQNHYLQKVGATQASKDIALCKGKAQSYMNNQPKGDGLKSGAKNAAKGAALGALGGAVMGKNVGRATGAGAAIGGTATAMNKVSERGARSPTFQQYANSCLEDLGYKVIEWR